MTVKQRISALREQMRANEIDACILLTDDYHASEYVGDFFKARAYFSGFTGSAGTLVVLGEEAYLWTDGRYYLQAEEQLRGSGITLMRDREVGVPRVSEFLAEKCAAGGRIALDGRTASCSFVKELAEKLKNTSATLLTGIDLVAPIWQDRPALSCEPIFELDAALVGATREEKLACVRENMAQAGCEYLVVTALDEIAWLLNLRGNDVRCTPVFLGFLLLGMQEATLCVQAAALPEDIAEKLGKAGIKLAPYGGIYDLLASLPAQASVWIDPRTANSAIMAKLPCDAAVTQRRSPICYLKALKTPEEAENMRLAHIKDGIALVRFLCWLKGNVGKVGITECSAAEKLAEFRAQAGAIGDSFDPIVAYGAHAAIVHYSANAQSNAALSPKGLCLCDTGAQYLQGTTDVTRTVVLGALTAQEKTMFTQVLRGHIALARAKFKKGVCGENLDALARAPLWEMGLDYNHGTGHGVGFLLGVHEGPQGIRYQLSGQSAPIALEEGMILSDEPGYYAAGQFGIRHENLLLVRRGEQTEYGQFMYFEPLTMVPFDREGIDVSLLSAAEIAWLDGYHEKVFQVISPYLTDAAELAFLRAQTAPIS